MLNPRSLMTGSGIAVGLLVLLAIGCGGDSEPETPDWPAPGPPLPFEDHCQPLLAEVEPEKTQPKSMCVLPVHSVLLEETFRAKVLTTESGRPLEPFRVGSPMAPILFATLPGDLVPDGLPGELDDPALSTSDTAPSSIDVFRRQKVRIPHTVEIIDSGDGHKLIAIHPRQPILQGHRITLRGFRVRGGELARQPEGFKRMFLGQKNQKNSGMVCDACARAHGAQLALAKSSVSPAICREHCFDNDPRLPKTASQIPEAFGGVEGARYGEVVFPKMQLGWVADRAGVGDPASSGGYGTAFGSAPLERAAVRITETEIGSNGARVVHGFFAAQRLHPRGPTTAERDDVAFTAVIPARLLAGGKVGRALLYAPKSFGARAEVESADAVALAEELESVLFSIDWIGSVGTDRERLASSVATNPTKPLEVLVDARQSIWNWYELSWRIFRELSLVPELMVGSALVFDPKFVGYIGNGHFLDGAVAAGGQSLIRRFVLVGGGGGLATTIEHSTTMAPFREALRGAAGEPMLGHALAAMAADGLNGIDPVTLARGRFGDRQPLDPILVQAVLGDTEVSNLATSLFTQTIAATQTMPASYVDPLLAENPFANESSPWIVRETGKAFVTYFDYGVRLPRGVEWPKVSNGLHEKLLHNKAAIRQMDAFLRPDGVAIHPCDGPCDPE